MKFKDLRPKSKIAYMAIAWEKEISIQMESVKRQNIVNKLPNMC